MKKEKIRIAHYAQSFIDPQKYCKPGSESGWGVFFMDQVTCKECLKKMIEDKLFPSPVDLVLDGIGSITPSQILQLREHLK